MFYWFLFWLVPLAALVLAILALAKSGRAVTARSLALLVARVYDAEQRLAALEATLAKHAAAAAADAGEPLAASAAPPLAPPPAAAVAASAPPAASSAEAAVAAGRRSEAEEEFAGRWLNYIGVVALVFATAFFLKYAFDNGWITPPWRVGLGLAAGAAILFASTRLHRPRLRAFSDGLVALGASILYLSIWAGWSLYGFFAQGLAFALMVAVTAIMAAMAASRRSRTIAALTSAGGALTPLLVTGATRQELALFAYLAVLAAGLLILAWRYGWRWLPPVQFAVTLLYFWGWFARYYDPGAQALTLVFAGVFFLIFAGGNFLGAPEGGDLRLSELVIGGANAAQLCVVLIDLLWISSRWALTLSVLGLALAHWLAARAFAASPQRARARGLYLVLALGLATLAIPIRLSGNWIPIGWALEGVVLTGGATIARRGRRLALGGLALEAAAAFLLFTVSLHPGTEFLWNERFFTLAGCAGCFAAAGWFARRGALRLGAQRPAAPLLYVGANLAVLVALSLDVWRLFARPEALGAHAWSPQLALSALWLAYSVALLAAGGLWRSALARWQGLALLGLTVIKAFLFDLAFLSRGYRIVSFLMLGLVLLGVSYLYQRRRVLK